MKTVKSIVWIIFSVFLSLGINLLNQTFYKSVWLQGINNNELNIYTFFRWMYLYLPVWLVGGYELQCLEKLQSVVICRIGSYRKYAFLVLKHVMGMTSIYITIFFMIIYMIKTPEIDYGMFIREVILISVHLLATVMIVVYVSTLYNAVVAVVSIMFIESTQIYAGVFFKCSEWVIPAFWSMYCRCIHEDDNKSMWIFVVIQIIVVICAIKFYWLLVKKEEKGSCSE